jgi:hypothetical protein
MILLGRHRALIHDAWSELAVRAAIEEIAADAIDHFHPDTFWPAHPSDVEWETAIPVFTGERPVSCGRSIIYIASVLPASLKTFALCSQSFRQAVQVADLGMSAAMAAVRPGV